MTGCTLTLASTARKIAAEAGVVSRELPDHAGYAKGIWGDRARRLIEGERRWDGKIMDEMMYNFSSTDFRWIMDMNMPRQH